MMRNIAVESLQKAGLGAYASTDGCACMDFSLHGIDVNVHCRKSGGNTHPDGGTTIRVCGRHADWDQHDDMLRAVGEEIARQLGEWIARDPREDFNIIVNVPYE
jgi:hypothetical protein